MKKLLFLIFIAVTIYAQPEIQYYYYNNMNSNGELDLSTLTPNTDTIWAGNYRAITTAADTANTINGTQELLMNHSWYRFRQTGTITKVSFYVHDATKLTTFKFKVWRKDNTLVSTAIFTLIATSADLVPQITNGINMITLATPINVRDGDYYSIQIVGTGNAIALKMSSSTAYNRTYSAIQNDSLSKNWSTGSTLTERYFPIKFFMSQSPVLALIGNSIIDGTLNISVPFRYSSGVSHLNYSEYDVRMTLGYKLGSYMNWTFQNMGIASESSSGILTRIPDVIGLNPRICIIEGGINDSLLANRYQAGTVTRIKAMIDSCLANDIVPIVEGLMPTQQRNNGCMQTADSVNTAIRAYCLSLGVQWIDLMSVLGKFRTGGTAGNLWDLKYQYMYRSAGGSGDSIHPTRNGNGVIARTIFTQAIKPYYYANDTARQYISHTALTDTVRAAFPLRFDAISSNFFGTDSVVFTYRLNSGSNTAVNMSLDSVREAGDEWRYTLAIDTSTIENGDTLNYSITAYGYGYSAGVASAIVSNSIIIRYKNWDADYLVLFGRRTVKPDFTRQTIENDLIADLRTAGVWSGMDWFWVGATDTIANSLYDWTSNANDPTAVNSPAYVENQGYTSSVGGAYINSGFALDADAVNFTQNSATLGLYIRTNVGENKYDMGIQSTAYTTIISRYGSDLFYFNVNQGGHSTVASTDSRGLFGAVRTASNLVAAYRNNDSLKSATNASSGIPAGNVYIGCRNNGSIATDFATKQYSIAFLGRGFTKTEWIAISTAINRYMTRIGSNVY